MPKQLRQKRDQPEPKTPHERQRAEKITSGIPPGMSTPLLNFDPESLAKAIAAASLPDLKAVVSSFFQQLGGPDAFAKLMVKELKDPGKRNAQLRSSVMAIMIRACSALADRQGSSDISLLDEKDIDRELAKLVEKAVSRQQDWKAANGQEEVLSGREGRAVPQAEANPRTEPS